MSSYKEPTTLGLRLIRELKTDNWTSPFFIHTVSATDWAGRNKSKTVHNPEIMTNQKQSGTKKPLLTYYRQQLMAHAVSSQLHQTPAATWTSDAGTGPGNAPVGPSSPLIGHKHAVLAPDWLAVPAPRPWCWCWTGSRNVLQGQPVQLELAAPNVGHNSDILSG